MPEYDIDVLEFDDDTYTVEQSLIRNKYKATNSTGEVVLQGKQKLFRMKEQFPFTDEDGTDVFEVKAGSIVDIAGNYVLTDAQTDEDIVVLDNDYSIFQDTWTIRDPDTETALAKINSRGAVVTMLRNLLPLGELIPHKYEITDQTGDHVGAIEGQLSLRDKYTITIDDASDVPKEATVASAMVIDAIQGN